MFNIPKLNFKVVSNDGMSAVFEFTPLLKGFGHTLGSVLRRTLYSSATGSVITRVHFDNVSHQFSTINGVKDDVLHIVLNLKKVRFEKDLEEPVELDLSMVGPATVTAGDIEQITGCRVVNPELVITELADKKSKIKVKLTVESGTGYIPAPEEVSAPIGTIFLDANYTPIFNVSMSVDDTRVGREANYDKLTMKVVTDGSLDPEVAIRNACRTLKEYFYRLETGEDYKEELNAEMNVDEVKETQGTSSVSADEVSLEELHLPTRTINALKKSGIKTLGDLADRSEDDLLRIRNLGEKSIREIIALLERENLK